MTTPIVPIPEELTPENELIVCVSGGKDSSALALWLRYDSGLPNKLYFCFCDTGHEHPWTIEHVKKLADRCLVELNVVKGPYTFITLAEKKQRFPSTKARFCTEELKVKPLREWMDEAEGRGEINNPVVVQGIRADESYRRSKLPAWGENRPGSRNARDAYECPIWRPIIHWSAEDVFEQHRRYGFDPNPLYKQGAKRVGCFPCIMSSRSEIRASFDLDPSFLPRLREYEDRVASAAARRRASFFANDKTPVCFHDQSFTRDDGEVFTYASIDGVRKWATGDENQLDLFEDDDPPTCWSHYGLCE